MPEPFLIFPWNRPFLPQLKRHLEAVHTGHGNSFAIPLLITPTARPWQYLQALYADEGKARVLPRLMTLDDAVTLWHASVNRKAPAQASGLDMVHLLYRAVRDALPATAKETPAAPEDDGQKGPARSLARMDLDGFFPWGEKLASLIDELLANGILPEDVLACEDEVLPAAAEVLSSLGQISGRYLEALAGHNLSTPGLVLYEVAQSLEAGTDRTALPVLPDVLQPRPDRPVYVMGFHSLSLTQERLIRALWEAGAHVCLHTDPKVADRAAWLESRMFGDADGAWTDDDTELFAGSGPAGGSLAGTPDGDDWPEDPAGTQDVDEEEWDDWTKPPVPRARTAGTGAQGAGAGAPTGQERTRSTASPAPDGTRPAGRDGRVPPARVHWICQRHVDWISSWSADTQLVEPADGEDGGTAPVMTFLSGYDLHSQLGALKEDLRGRDPAKRAAIIVPSPGLLMPVLHHIPEEARPDLNIAMGFCLAEAPIYQLLRDVLAAQGNRDENGRYHWRRLLACVDSPLLAGIDGPDGQPILPAIRRYRAQLRHSLRFLDPRNDVLTTALFDERPEERQALSELLRVFLDSFADLHSTRDLARALGGVCEYLHLRGQRLRTSSALDMEALYRMEHGLIPQLANTLLGTSELSLQTLLRIFEELAHHEYLFFEPGRHSRLANLQILSVLESTLLSFDTVYLLDATDDRLPGNKKHDPLLPDSLRAVLGLPDLDEGDLEIGYAVHRLCASCRETRFYWQEGISRTYLFDGKKSRSRFVEEYIWQQEQAAGRVFEPGEGPLGVVSCSLTPMAPARRLFRVQDRVLEAMHKTLDYPLSPSALDQYLACPLAFGFRRLAGLRELATVNESDDPLGVGTLVHEVLEKFHRLHLGDTLPDRKAAARELVQIFRDTLHAPECLLKETLPPESLAMLEAVGERKLEDYMHSQPEDSCPVLLEHDLQATLDIAGTSVLLEGRIDRLDRRGEDNRLVVLDYKTSKHLPGINRMLWTQDELFAQARSLAGSGHLADAELALLDSLLAQVRSYATSVQLACYVTMCRQTSLTARSRRTRKKLEWPEGRLADAAYVYLADKGQEVSFFSPGKSDTDDARDRIMELCPDLVSVVVMHMHNARTLPQVHTPMLCGRCPYASLCQS